MGYPLVSNCRVFSIENGRTIAELCDNLIIRFRLKNGNAPFEVKLKIPKMILDAKYTSTGILIVIPANGNGTFHAEMGKFSDFLPLPTPLLLFLSM